MALSQDGRAGSFDTPLGKDKLALTRFRASEGLSELFLFRVDALSEEHNIDFNPALGQNCSLTFTLGHGGDRFFNGILVEAQWTETADATSTYRLVLRPWLWLLSRTADCRIFHDKTALEIIRTIFDERGFPYQVSCRQHLPKLEYCVQYRETEFDFVSRLMEQHGLYYFFEHSREQHVLWVVDNPAAHKPVPGLPSIDYLGVGRQVRRDREHLVTWRSERRFQTGRYTLNDYDYMKPPKDLQGEARAQSGYKQGDLEVFDHPGFYTDKSDGETLAKVRLEAFQARDRRRYAEGNAISLEPGWVVRLNEHPNQAENKPYLVVRASHEFVAQSYRSNLDGGDTEDYRGDYVFQDQAIPYRAKRTTRKPVIHGAQTAKVVGKKGEEIDVDEHGRILVHFFWDRHNEQSRRVRVAQTWAGPKWGAQMIPRLGMEVVVDYLEGDPDQPLVVGCVYNGDNKVPYDLPGNQTQSGTKSDSSKGHHGYNEFMFEDKKGSEFVRMHAEKNHLVRVNNDETISIGHDQKEDIGHDRNTTVANDDELTVGTFIQPGQRRTMVMGNNGLLVFEGGASRFVPQGLEQTLALTIDQFATTSFTMEANATMMLTCGASSIALTPAGIVITAPTIALNGTTALSGPGTIGVPPVIKPL